VPPGAHAPFRPLPTAIASISLPSDAAQTVVTYHRDGQAELT